MEDTYLVKKEILIQTPLPEETRTYKPISHESLIDLTLNSIALSGFKIDKEQYSSARGGNIANGKFSIKNVADTEMQLQIGWQNSYDKTMSLKFAIGTRIFICGNGCVSGDMGAFKKAHRGEIQTFTPQAITEYIKKAGDAFKRIQMERDKMKTIEISPRVRAELIGRMIIEDNFIESNQLGLIRKEIKAPTYDYGCPNTLWELYNFTTFAMKDIHPSFWIQNHMDAHRFFVNAAGITPAVINLPQVMPIPNQIEMFTNELE